MVRTSVVVCCIRCQSVLFSSVLFTPVSAKSIIGILFMWMGHCGVTCALCGVDCELSGL